MAYLPAENIRRRNDPRCSILIDKHYVLEEKLAAARKHNTQLRKRLTVGFLVITGLCSLILFGLSSFDFSAVTKPQPASSETISVKAGPEEIDSEQARETFKQMLQHYKNELESALETANVEQWNQAAATEIDTLEQNAMLHFSNGDYAEALQQIRSLHTKATATLADAQKIFEENMQAATSFFEQDRHNEAKRHIDKALLVNAQSPEAQTLQRDIETLKQILPLLNGANVARTENNLQKEHHALRQILQIAPKRQQTAERFKLLDQRIRDQQFETHIAAGFNAIKKQQTQKARQHYQKARKANSNRRELSVLFSQITEQEKTHRIQNAMSRAKQAVEQDNWQQAKTHFTQVLKDIPDNKTATEGLKRANEILALQAKLNQYTQDPYRLSDGNVLNAAEATLAQAQHVSNDSVGIKKQIQQLRSHITTFNQPIPVTITSDNKTYILIRSVGKVGTLSQKTIKLKPGRYTFEGIRDGYKSKLLPVQIPHNQNSFSIRLICDEPI